MAESRPDKLVSYDSVPDFKAGSPIIGSELDALRRRIVRESLGVSGVDDESINAHWSSNLSKAREFKVTNVGSTIFERYSVFGIKTGSTLDLTGETEYAVNCEETSTNIEYLFSNQDRIITSGEWGFCIPIGFWQPVLVRYRGTAPSILDKLGINNGAAEKDVQQKSLIAVSNADTANQRVWVVKYSADAESDQWVRFTTDAPFAFSDNTVQGDIQDWWNGDPPPVLLDVTFHNTCNMFFAEAAGACGIARWDSIDLVWRIINIWEARTRFIHFTTNEAVSAGQPTFPATVQESWDGEGVSGTVTVYNTGGLFEASGPNVHGIARWDYADDPKTATGHYQCVYLPPKDQPAKESTLIAFKTNASFTILDTEVNADLVQAFNGIAPATPLNVYDPYQMFFAEAVDTHGFAAWNETAGRYEILAIREVRARFIRFTADNKFYHDDATVAATVVSWWDGINPDTGAQGITVVNTDNKFYAIAANTYGIARFDYETGQYQIVDMWDADTRFITFQATYIVLKTNPTFEATVLENWDGTTTFAGAIQVVNTGGIFYSEQTGAIGIARIDIVDSEATGLQYNCVYMDPKKGETPAIQAKTISFSTNTGFDLSDTTVLGTVIDAFDGVPPADPVTLHNPYGMFFAEGSGKQGYAGYNDPDSRWEIINIKEVRARFIKFTSDSKFWIDANTINVTVTNYWDGENPDPGALGLTVNNTCNQFYAIKGTTCGIARYDYSTGNYNITMMWERNTEFITFTADGPVDKADPIINITGVDRSWDGIGAPSPPTLTYVTNTCEFRSKKQYPKGIARLDVLASHASGTEVYNCVYLDPTPDTDQASAISFRTKFADFTIEQTTVTGIVIERFDGETPAPLSELTLQDPYQMWDAKDANTEGYAVWDEIDGHYEIIAIKDTKARFIRFTADIKFDYTVDVVAVTITDYWDGANPGASANVNNTCNKFHAMHSGKCGIARLDKSTGEYNIVNLWNEDTRFVVFATSELVTKAMTEFDASITDTWDGTGDAGPVVIQNTGQIFESRDYPATGIARLDEPATLAGTGTKVYSCVYLDPKDPIEPPAEASVIAFKTTTGFAISDTTVSVDVLDFFDGIGPPSPLTIHDPYQMWFAEKASAHGYAAWNDFSARYEIITLQEVRARFIKFTAPAFDYSDNTVSVTVDAHWDGIDPDPGDIGLIINNTNNKFYSIAGSAGVARYDYETKTYNIVDLWDVDTRFIHFVSKYAFLKTAPTFEATVSNDSDGVWDGVTVFPTAPTSIDINNTGNIFFAEKANTHGIARLNINKSIEGGAVEYNCVYLDSGADVDQSLVISFSLNVAFGIDTPFVAVKVENLFNGSQPLVGATINVYDKHLMFENLQAAPSNIVHGYAYWDNIAGQYEIFYLEQNIATFIRFLTDGKFTLSTTSIGAAVTEFWDGRSPGSSAIVYDPCQQFQSIDKACGVARYDYKSSQYKIINIWDEDSRFIHFIAPNAVSKGSANFTISVQDHWDGTGATATTCKNPGGMFFSEKTNSHGIARLDIPESIASGTATAGVPTYQCVYLDPQKGLDTQATLIVFKSAAEKDFELTSVSAYVERLMNGVDPLVGSLITIYDPYKMWKITDQDIYGYAYWSIPLQRYEILAVEETRARFIQFSTDSYFSLGENDIPVSVESFWDGRDPDPAPPQGLTIKNTDNKFFALQAGTKGVARYNYYTKVYEIISIWRETSRFMAFETTEIVSKINPTFKAKPTFFMDGNKPVAPTVELDIVNTEGIFSANSYPVHGIARLDELASQGITDPAQLTYNCVYLPGTTQEAGATNVFSFRTNTSMTYAQTTVSVTVVDRLSGDIPAEGAIVTVHDPHQMWEAETSNLYGYAVYNDDPTQQRYEIIALEKSRARFIRFSAAQSFTNFNTSFNATLVEYWDGKSPGGGIFSIVNSGQRYFGHSGMMGLARWNENTKAYHCVYIDYHPRMVEFHTTETFENDADYVSGLIDDTWNNEELSTVAPFQFRNVGNMFFGKETNLTGIAREDITVNPAEWKIIQLKCIPPATQAVYNETTLPAYAGTPVVMPMNAFDISAGDLISIDGEGSVLFERTAYGAIRVQLESFWDSQAGPSAAETSYVTFQVNQGAGWVDVPGAGLSLTHVYQRVPPTNYIMGGTSSRSYWSQVIYQAGDRIRLRAYSLGGTTITSMGDLSLEILESFSPPIV